MLHAKQSIRQDFLNHERKHALQAARPWMAAVAEVVRGKDSSRGSDSSYMV